MKNASAKKTVRRRFGIVAMPEKHGRLTNAGQPCWEDRILASSPFRDLAMTRDFLDSLSEKLQAPYLSVPTRHEDSTKIEA